jgi:hypothetical protein
MKFYCLIFLVLFSSICLAQCDMDSKVGKIEIRIRDYPEKSLDILITTLAESKKRFATYSDGVWRVDLDHRIKAREISIKPTQRGVTFEVTEALSLIDGNGSECKASFVLQPYATMAVASRQKFYGRFEDSTHILDTLIISRRLMISESIKGQILVNEKNRDVRKLVGFDFTYPLTDLVSKPKEMTIREIVIAIKNSRGISSGENDTDTYFSLVKKNGPENLIFKLYAK